MGLVTGVVLPNEGDRIKAANYNDPITKILAQLNGNIDGANIAAGAIDATKFAPNAVQNALGVTTDPAGGWNLLNANVPPTVSSGYNKGQSEYELLFSNVDLSSVLSPGMRMKVDRTGTTPTQCPNFVKTSTQYASRTSGSVSGFSFVDDFTCEAWIKLTSIPSGSEFAIISRDSGVTGFYFSLDSTARPQIVVRNATSTFEYGCAYQSVPVGQWTHVAATMDLSGNASQIYINGVAVPTEFSSGGLSTFTQAGNLQIGASNGTNTINGEIADARVWNTIRTATQIRDNMNQQLVGTETNLIGYWKLAGNFNDSTANGNTLTASGGATATFADHPFKSTEYSIVTKVAYSAPNTTVTVFTGTDHNIPNMTLANPYFSTQKIPLNFPISKNKWIITIPFYATYVKSVGSASTWYVTPYKITTPSGAWAVSYKATTRFGGGSPSAAVNGRLMITEQTSDYLTSAVNTTESESVSNNYVYTNNSTIQIAALMAGAKTIDRSAQSTWSIAGITSEAAGSYIFELGGLGVYQGQTTLYAECAYI